MSAALDENRAFDLRLALAVVKHMENTGGLSAGSALLLYTKLAERYGRCSGSILFP